MELVGGLARRVESARLANHDGLLRSGFSAIARTAAAHENSPRRGMSEAAQHRLPGDRLPADEIARMLRVDHAGEYGATRIYQGQLDVLGGGRAGVIRQMAETENRHLARFETLL